MIYMYYREQRNNLLFQESAYNFTTVTQEIIQIKLNWNFEHLEPVSP